MKRILFYEPYGWHLHVVWETTIGHALKLRGADVKHVACDALFSECDVYRENINPRDSASCLTCKRITSSVYEMMKVPYEWLGNYIPRHVYPKLKEWIHSIPDDELLSAIWRGYPVGEWATPSACYQFRMSTFDFNNDRQLQAVRNYVYGTAVSIEGLIPLYDDWQPETLLLLNGRFFSHRTAMELALERNIRVVVHERGKLAGSLSFRENVRVHDLQIYRDIWDEWREIPLNTEELEEINTILANRRVGKGLNWRPFSPPPQNEEEVRKELNLGDHPVIVVFSSSDDETVTHPEYREGAFPNPFDWILALLELVHKFPDHIFIIRMHPNLTAHGVNQQALNQFLSLRSHLPENVRIVMPDDKISSYTLADMAEVGLVYFSTIGLEMAAKGQPVVAVAKGFYGHCGFVNFVESPLRHEDAIRSALKQGRQLETARQAYRFAYHVYHDLSIPFPLVVEDPRYIGKPTYKSTEDLLPGKDESLDRVCRYIIGGEPLFPQRCDAHQKRTKAEEDQFFHKVMPELFERGTVKPSPISKLNRPKEFGFEAESAESFDRFMREKAEPLPKISVIIPTYNRSAILRKCLDALAMQTLPPKEFEVLVCDDGATDDTAEVIEKYSTPYKLHYLCQDNKGPASARNMGIVRAKGTYLLFLNDDAIAEPDLLYRHLETFTAHQGEKIAVLGKFSLLPEYMKSPFGYIIETAGLLFGYPRMKTGQLYNCDNFYTCNLSILRQDVVDVGMFDEDFTKPAAEDLDLGYRLQQKGYKVLFDPNCVTWHDHPISPENFFKIQKMRGECFVTFALKHPEINPYKKSNKSAIEATKQKIKGLGSSVQQSLDKIVEAHNLASKQCLNPQDFVVLVKNLEPLVQLLQEYFYHEGILGSPFFDRLVEKREADRPVGREAVDSYGKEVCGRSSDNVTVDVVMLTWNNIQKTKRTIDSIEKYVEYPYRLIAVDNGSTDGTIEYLKEKTDILIANKENIGAIKARNQAIRELLSDYVLFIDNDIEVGSDIIAQFVRAMESDPKIGIVGSLLNQKVGSNEQGIDIPQGMSIEKVNKLCSEQPRGIKDATYIISCCMMVRRDAIEDVGFFDDDYKFYSYEDFDYCLRAKLLGWRVVIDPSCFVWHHINTSVKQFDDLDDITTNNLKVFSRKWLKKDLRIAIIYDNTVRKDTTGEYCKRALQSIVKEVDHYLPGDVNKIPRGYDLYLNIDDSFQYVLPAHLRPSAWWVIDTHLQYDWDVKKAKTFDFVFAAQEDGAERLKADGISNVRWLPLACDPSAHKQFRGNRKAYDFCFVGNIFPGKRADNLKILAEKYPNHFIGNAYFHEMAKIYSQSKVVFNQSIKNDVNMRVFEAMSCGTLLLTNDLKDNGQGQLFEPNKHLVTFSDMDEACRLMGHYLKNEEEREKIAREGMLLVHTKHTYRNRMVTLLNNIFDGQISNKDSSTNILEPKNKKIIRQKKKSIQKSFTSIIILAHNQLEYTKKCIDSIFKHTKEPFELIVVDNGSTDGTVEYLESEVRGQKTESRSQKTEVRGRKSEVRIEIIKNKENLGFAVGNNQGMAVAEGDYILLMNNDLVVTPGWLGRLIACAEQKPQIGIVGPMSNYVSGPQLVKEVSYDTTSLARLNKFSQAFARKHAGQAMPFWRVVGFCMLIKRAVIEKIGGLDGRFGLGNFEDDDFSLRATLAGFESCIASDCFVHHFGSRTFVGARIDYRESLYKNWGIFKKKWGIPADVAYGAPYDMASILRQGFIPAKHYCPLGQKEYSGTDVIAPEASDERLLNGEALFHEGRFKEAEEIFREVLKECPNHPKARNDLACLLWQTGRSEDALGELTKAMETAPDDRDVVWNCGQFLIELGFPEDALKVYQDFLERHPDDLEVRETVENIEKRPVGTETTAGDAKTLIEEGEELFSRGKVDAAKKIFEQILLEDTQLVEPLNNLGVIAFQEGEIGQAVSYFTRVLEIDPDYFEAMENLGKCMEAKQDHAEGVKWFKRALGLRPDDISLLNSLGNCFIQTEDFVTAREVYEKSLQLDSSQESIEMILREMGRLEEAKKVGT